MKVLKCELNNALHWVPFATSEMMQKETRRKETRRYSGDISLQSILLFCLLQPCVVQNSTQMVCPTPNLYQDLYEYLPSEYLEKLNDDNTEIVNPGNSRRIPQRKKRSSTESESTLLGLLQNYVSEMLVGSTGNMELFNKNYEIYILKIFHMLTHFCITTQRLQHCFKS